MTKKEKVFIGAFLLAGFLAGFVWGELTLTEPLSQREPAAYKLLERAYESE